MMIFSHTLCPDKNQSPKEIAIGLMQQKLVRFVSIVSNVRRADDRANQQENNFDRHVQVIINFVNVQKCSTQK